MKKKLLYASPFKPLRSGISDYSEVLIYGLGEFFDITLLIDNYKLENKKLYEDFGVLVYKENKINLSFYDYIIYNVGNNPHYHSYIYECALKWPGMIILHDFVLYYLTIAFYRNKETFYSKVYEMEGAAGINLLKKSIKEGKDLLECKELAPLLPLNKELINSNNLIMTHSFYTYDKIAKITDKKERLRKINLVELIDDHFAPIAKNLLMNKYRIPDNCLLLSSFGSVAHTKLNHIICEIVDEINSSSDRKICYVMVGDGNYVDHKLNDYIIKTGYIDLLEFNSFICHSDLIINMRYPSMGETSASLIRILGLGKPCLVSNDAWFAELPDDLVIKINIDKVRDDLMERIIYLLDNPGKLFDISAKTRNYINANHSLKQISKDIYEFLQDETYCQTTQIQ